MTLAVPSDEKKGARETRDESAAPCARGFGAHEERDRIEDRDFGQQV